LPAQADKIIDFYSPELDWLMILSRIGKRADSRWFLE